MNLTILALGLAVMGVSVGEGILVANIAKAAARQPEMFKMCIRDRSRFRYVRARNVPPFSRI